MIYRVDESRVLLATTTLCLCMFVSFLRFLRCSFQSMQMIINGIERELRKKRNITSNESRE
jgi:hypothetical protein